jgi:P-type Mg2+ transporter
MPVPDVKAESPFWQPPVTALIEHLNSSPEGLSSAEAAARLTHFGPNLIQAERKRALLLQLLAKFRNPLVIILLTASALSAFTGDATSFFIISTIVLISVTLDFVQEYRAGQATERLRQSVAVLLPITPAGVYLGFVAPPPFFFLLLTAMLLAYLLAVEGVKQWFFRHLAAE